MKRTLLAGAVLLLLAGVARSALLPYSYPQQGPFWVATTGNDSTGDGSRANPWATIQKARDYIRTNHLNLAQIADLIVNVRSGDYSIVSSGPIVFGKNDSGHNGHSVIYRSFDGVGSARIVGGTRITGWSLVSGSTYVASVPNTFWTVYENDVRSISARFPKRSPGAGFPLSQAPYLKSAGTVPADDLRNVTYKTVDITPDAWAMSDLQIVIWGGSSARAWLDDTAPVTSLDVPGHTFTLPNQVKFLTYGESRYFVQGVKDNLSAPGEWYLDRSGMLLYYIARDGAIASQTIIVPAVTEAFQFFGDSINARVSSIALDGFAVQYTDFVQWYRQGYAYDDVTVTQFHPSPQAHLADPSADYFAQMPSTHLGAIHLRNTDNVTVTNSHIKNVGTTGVFIDGYGQNDTVTMTWIEGTGIDGIHAEGSYPGYGDFLGHNSFVNDRINNHGELSGGASGIGLWQSGSNLIQYDYIHDGPRKGIWVYANSGLGQAGSGWIYGCNNTIDHTLVKFECQDSGDTGAVTFSSLNNIASPGSCVNTVSQVVIDHVNAHASMIDVAPHGAFCDDQTGGAPSGGQDFTNVQVSNTQGNQFRANNSAGHVLTNTSFNSDGTVNGSFNAGLMDTANIGTTSAFPYP